MASPHGIAGQFGYAAEATPGTPVVVDTFLPVNEETLNQEIERIEDTSIRAGRLTSPGWSPGRRQLTGPIQMPLWNVDVALLWLHMFGAVAVAGDVKTYTPGDLTGKGLTVQVGLPDIGGVVRGKTWSGCKVDTWSLAANEGEAAQLTVNLRGMAESTETALATASYDAALERFTFVHANLTIAGASPALVRSFSIDGNNQVVARHGLGDPHTKQPLENDIRAYTGSVAVDFEDLTAYNRYVAGNEAALEVVFDNGTEQLELACNVRFDGTTPRLGGPARLDQALPFVSTSRVGDADAITVKLTNGDDDPT